MQNLSKYHTWYNDMSNNAMVITTPIRLHDTKDNANNGFAFINV